MSKLNIQDFIPARRYIDLSTGAMIRILREWHEWTQEQVAERSGISATNISLLENDRVDIGKKRAESLARAFGVHPAIIMFPGYDAENVKLAA